jgi:lipoic acid synthetase
MLQSPFIIQPINMTDHITRDRLKSDILTQPAPRRPDYIRVRAPGGESYDHIQNLMRSKSLHTVCEEAHCPNMGECWESGTATFLILGDICTRSCGFCDIRHGRPGPLDPREPEQVAQAVKSMGLKHAVITSVNRDELPDGGASVFAEVIYQIRKLAPGCTVEVLIPDFKGDLDALASVMTAHPEILNHNIETVPSLFRKVQPQDRYEWSERILRNARLLDPGTITKSGIMVGLGESIDEVKEMMCVLRDWGVEIITIGQYLQPSRKHLPIERYYTLEEFSYLRTYGLDLGFRWVESAPLVRSSYHASLHIGST